MLMKIDFNFVLILENLKNSKKIFNYLFLSNLKERLQNRFSGLLYAEFLFERLKIS